jgi:hypothetical protein
MIMPIPQSLKVSKLILQLKEMQKEFGDVPVYLSKDEGGNGYGALDWPLSFGAFEKKAIILYPSHEFYDFD